MITRITECIPLMNNSEFTRAFRGLGYMRVKLDVVLADEDVHRKKLVYKISDFIHKHVESMTAEEIASLVHS